MRPTELMEQWFELPDDPDGGRIKLRQLSPGDKQDIYDQTLPMVNEFRTDPETGALIPTTIQKINRKLDREITLTKCLVGWENFFDEKGKKLPCTPENVLKAIREFDGLLPFINECRLKLDEVAEAEKTRQKKTSRPSPKG